MFRITALILMLALSLAACETATNGPDTPRPNPGQLEPYIAKGRALDTQGNPLSGAKIIVDNTIFYNAAVTGTTDAQGGYRISIPDGSWRVYAKIEREYNGYTYDIDLAPDTFDSFAGTNGAVRNFTWRLTGKKPEPLVGYFGGSVLVFGDELYDVENVELTLTPVGPLIDGSTGEVVSRRPNGPDVSPPSEAEDIPLGRYVADYGTVTPPAAGLELQLEVVEGSAPGEVEPHSVQGHALDTQGRPIAGAKVWIDPAITWDEVIERRTDASGRYLVTGLPNLPFYAKAWIDVDYGGERYCLRLGMPSAQDYEAFSPEAGVIRNFRWQLTGVIEDLRDHDGYFGGEARIFPYGITGGIAELTFTPTAPLVDGSTIQPFTRTIDLTRDVIIYDIPLGLYDVTAVLVAGDGTRTPLKVGSEYGEPIQTDSAALAFGSLGYCSDGSGIARAVLQVENP